jgi:ribose 5-phosphate isomerase B
MRIAVGADHAGFPLKDTVIAAIESGGHEAVDLGTYSTEACDYPDIAEKVGRAVVAGKADRGVIVCGSGAGVAVAANKITGTRASCIHDHYTAAQAVEHDDVNVLCIGARVIGPATAEELVTTYLGASFSGEERHLRRLNKVLALEQAMNRD